MSTPTDLAIHLETLEKELLTREVRFSGRAASFLDDEFVEFGSSGRVFNKTQIVASLTLENDDGVVRTATNFKVVELGAGTALVTYRVLRHSVPPVASLRSSIWRFEKDRWQMIFHQGTLAK
ncbi:MAG: DUF4440 domain-containing protein [Burkholderiales bacterium]